VAKKELVIAFVLLFILGFTTGSSTNETMNQGEMRINVGLRSLSSKAEVTDLTSQYGGKMIRELAPLKVLTFKVPRVVFEYMVFDENLSNLVEYIEEDYMRQIDLRDYEVYTEGESTANVELLPNDPGYQFQWGPPCIGAEDGWDVELGSPDTIVAVVDTGIDLDHPDLTANVDTSIDWDFVNDDPVAQDDHGHGTHVAGIVAAEVNNNKGIAGLQQITLMAVKGLNENGQGFTSDLAAGIVYAADNGARVINCSWGGYGFSNTMNNAVNYAFNRGALVVAAAGNDGVSTPHYPSSYAKALGVAALRSCNARAPWSNWGWDNVYLSAPGENIASTWFDNRYAYASGTSMASPHVAGVAAMYFSYNPNFTVLQVAQHMFRNADDLGNPGRDEFYGHGRVDMYPFN
jgi:subtilisin family serine protease